MKQFEPQYETLVDVFDRSVRDYGPRELFGTKKDGRWVWLTYADFGALVARFRSGLGSLGLKTGDRVAIISNNRVEWAVAAYASYGVGAALVPMYEAQSAKDWEFIVRDCGARALIVSTSAILAKARPLLDTIDTLERIVLIAGTDAGDSRITTYDALLSAAAHATPAIRPTRDDLATILYTSGTTGNPKGVVLSHGNIASNVSGAKQQFPIRATDRSLSILPWAHAFGQTADLHMMFASGAGIAICEGNDKILDNLAEV